MPAFSTFPPAPIPGSLEFEEAAGTVLDHMPTFVDEANAFRDEVVLSTTTAIDSAATATAQATAAGASAASAAISATASAASANFKGSWASLTGALNMPASVLHNGQLWQLTANLANVTTATPGVSGSWFPVATLDRAQRAPIGATLDLNFAKGYGEAYNPATGRMERLSAWSDLITYTGSGRSYVDAKGLVVAQSSNVPRLTFDPVTGAGLGLSVWDARTNLFLNSLVDGTPLATQAVTLSAGSHRLSFYGTGSVTLSGAATGSLTGSGAYPTRSGLTFTATAGSVTFTVAGSVQFAMLTTGAADSPFIPTAGAAATATKDLPVISGSNFSKWFNGSEGTFVYIFQAADVLTDSGGATRAFVVNNGTNNERLIGYGNGFSSISAGTGDGISTSGANRSDLVARASCYSATQLQSSVAGAAVVTDSSYTRPTGLNQIFLGRNGDDTNTALNGTLGRILYFPRALPANLQALSA